MKQRINDLNEVAEALRTEYTQAGDGNGFILKIDDLNVDELTKEAQRAKELQSQLTTSTSLLEKKLNEALSEQNKWKDNFLKSQLHQKATESFLKNGGQEEAIEFALGKISNVFTIDESGTIKSKVKRSDGTEHTLDSYIADDLGTNAKFLFKASKGTGATGGAGSNLPEINPFAKKTWNLTEQILLKRKSPDIAKQLEAQAKNS